MKWSVAEIVIKVSGVIIMKSKERLSGESLPKQNAEIKIEIRRIAPI